MSGEAPQGMKVMVRLQLDWAFPGLFDPDFGLADLNFAAYLHQALRSKSFLAEVIFDWKGRFITVLDIREVSRRTHLRVLLWAKHMDSEIVMDFVMGEGRDGALYLKRAWSKWVGRGFHSIEGGELVTRGEVPDP